MRQDTYLARRDEKWVIEHVAGLVAKAIIERNLPCETRRSLMRLLFGLQRFPRRTPGLNLQLEFPEVESFCVVEMSEESLSIRLGKAKLQYFPGCNQFFDYMALLDGWERQHMLENWLPFFDGMVEPDTPLHIEDYSNAEAVDVPPLTDAWDDDQKPIIFDISFL